MKQRTWWRGLVTALALAAVAPAWANGAVFDSAHRTAGNAWSPSKRFHLKGEHLALKLGAEGYSARVAYTLEEPADSAGRKDAVMYFPVVCAPAAAPDAPLCVEHFQASLNGRPLAGQWISAENVDKNPALRRLADRLSRRLPEDHRRVQAEFGSAYFFHKLEIPAGVRAEELVVSYSAVYAQVESGTSDSAHARRGKARVLYDFSPAAAWAGPQSGQSLTIEVDTAGLQNHLEHRSRDWPFIREGRDRYTLEVHDPDYAKMPPLSLEADNGNYLSFMQDMKSLVRLATRYGGSLHGAAPPSAEHGDVKALFDRDPDTFWCWSGPQAVLDLRLDAMAFDEQPGTGVFEAWLEGLVVLNGAVRDKATFDRHGRARSIVVSVGPLRSALTLPQPDMKEDRDRFQALVTLGRARAQGDTAWLDAFSPTTDLFRGDRPERPTLADRKNIRQRVVRLNIKGTRTQAGDENCISEIYPLYNGG